MKTGRNSWKLNNAGYFKLCSLPASLVVNYLLITSVSLMRHAEARAKMCRKFEQSQHGGIYEEAVPETFSKLCPPSSAAYNIYVVEDGSTLVQPGDVNTYTMLICWTNDVKRFALQFHDNVHLDTSGPVASASLRTCVVTNDTIHYKRRHQHNHSHKLLLKISTASTFQFRGYFDTRKSHAHKHHFVTYKYDREEAIRRRRSVEETPEYTDSSECGKSRNCVRFGSSDCQHFECDYFLSTNVTGREVDIELSGKTVGWVALGLSSDENMGGDEVIACFKTDPVGLEVRAGTFENAYGHDPTKLKDSTALKLISWRVQDDYLYCRLTRPEWLKDHQDLSNTWFQLYARGSVSPNGDLEKHHTTPVVSSKMLSLLNKYNIIGRSSIATPSIFMTSFFVITLTLIH